MTSLLCIISILASIAFAYYEKSQDDKHLDNIEMDQHATPFFVKKSELTIEQELAEFKKLAKEYKATIIRTDILNKKDLTIVYKSGVFSADYFKDSKIKLVDGHLPQNEKEFLATHNTKNKNQSGQIYDLFADHPLIFGSLTEFYKQNTASVNGGYTLIVDDNHKDAALNQLSNFFKISKKELLMPTYEHGYGEGTFYLLAIIFSVVILAIFCLMNVFYPISRLKEIGVMKIIGFKNFDIWKQLNTRVLFTPAILYLITIPVQKLIIKQSSWNYFFKLTILQAIILAICLLFTFIMLIVIQKYKLSGVLKNFFNFRISLYLCYILKFFIFIALVAVIPLMAKELTTLLNELEVANVYKQEQNYLTLAKYTQIDNEFQEELNGNDIFGKKLVNLYKELEKTVSAQYVVVEGVDADIQHGKYQIMQANYNYLKKLNYKFPVSLSKLFAGDQLTVLVPSHLKNRFSHLKSSIRDGAYVYFPKNDPLQKTKNFPIRFIFYQDNNKEFFSENIQLIYKNKGFVKDPIIICLSDRFFNEISSFLSVSALHNPLRILDTVKNRQAISQAIVNNDLENNSLQFANVFSTGFARELKIAQTTMIAWASFLISAIIVSILASYYIILIILTSKRKEMLVNRLLGYSFFERYRNEIFYFCTIYLFGLAEIFILNHQFFLVMLYLILVLIDILIIYLMVKKYEKGSLALALKGEE